MVESVRIGSDRFGSDHAERRPSPIIREVEMPSTDAPLRRTAALTPMLVALLAVLVAAIALTIAGVAVVVVIIAWIAVAMVGGATLAIARRAD